MNSILSTKKVYISHKAIICFLILFPFIRQRTLEELPNIIIQGYRIWAIAASACIYLSAFKKIYNFFKKKELVLLFFFWMTYLVATLINSPRQILYTGQYVFIMFALVLYIFMNAPKKMRTIVETLSFIYSVYIVLNFVTDIIFPHGLYQASRVSYHTGHLLGDDNAIIYVCLPGIVIAILNSLIKKNKISRFVWLEIAMTAYCVYRVYAVSAMIAITLFVGLLIYVLKVDDISYRLLLIIIVGTILFCLFGLSSDSVQNFIVTYFNKSATLSGRTRVWAMALEMISHRPILGYGGYYQNGRFAVSRLFTYSAHTPYLQLLIDGGIILFAQFVVLIQRGFTRMKTHKNNAFATIICIGLTCMMINYITEQVQFYHLMILLSLLMNIEYFPDIDRRILKK